MAHELLVHVACALQCLRYGRLVFVHQVGDVRQGVELLRPGLLQRGLTAVLQLMFVLSAYLKHFVSAVVLKSALRI